MLWRQIGSYKTNVQTRPVKRNLFLHGALFQWWRTELFPKAVCFHFPPFSRLDQLQPRCKTPKEGKSCVQLDSGWPRRYCVTHLLLSMTYLATSRILRLTNQQLRSAWWDVMFWWWCFRLVINVVFCFLHDIYLMWYTEVCYTHFLKRICAQLGKTTEAVLPKLPCSWLTNDSKPC